MRVPVRWVALTVGLAVLVTGLLIVLSQLSAQLATAPTAPREPQPTEKPSEPAAPEEHSQLPEQPTLGAPDAPVMIIEFAEFYCPFCAKFTWETFPQLERDYIRTGLVRYEMRNLVVHGEHALLAAVAGECAHAQGKFWPFMERIFEAVFPGRSFYQHQQLGVEDLKRVAEEVKLDLDVFCRCLEGYVEQYDSCQSQYTQCAQEGEDVAACREEFSDCLGANPMFQEVLKDQAELRYLIEQLPPQERERAKRIGTPAFFIDGHILIGAQPYNVFKQVIERELEQVETKGAIQ